MSRDRGATRGQSLAEMAIFLPILLVLFLGIADFARVFATMITIESAARDAADWGAHNPGYWETTVPQYPVTVAEMERRACTPATALPEFQPAGGTGATCTNPTFQCTLELPGGGTSDCSSPTSCADNIGAATVPCKVNVKLTYTFDLITPGDMIGLPASITFDRTSIFAIADTPASP